MGGVALLDVLRGVGLGFYKNDLAVAGEPLDIFAQSGVQVMAAVCEHAAGRPGVQQVRDGVE